MEQPPTDIPGDRPANDLWNLSRAWPSYDPAFVNRSIERTVESECEESDELDVRLQTPDVRVGTARGTESSVEGMVAAYENDVVRRERLSGPAFRGLLRLTEFWQLTTDESVDLLGASLSSETFADWASGTTKPVLNGDQLMRVSLLLGIYEGLARTWRHAKSEAERWFRRPRSDGPFLGATPLDFMRTGGIQAFVLARGYVDGITGGGR